MFSKGRLTAAHNYLKSGLDVATATNVEKSLNAALHAHVVALVEVGNAHGEAAYDLINRAIAMYEHFTD